MMTAGMLSLGRGKALEKGCCQLVKLGKGIARQVLERLQERCCQPLVSATAI
jgi:hypothetical protein